MAFKIYVGNLPFEHTAADVEALFAAHGRVTHVQLATDRATGRSRGHAFVTMDDEVDGWNAIAAVDGETVAGRRLRASQKLPRGQRPDPRQG